MIWSTFEHKDNAPLCDGSSTSPPSGWTFASNSASNCLSEHPVSPGAPPSRSCARFSFNAFPPPTESNEICRQYANGNQPGKSINGNDNAANLLAIYQLNESLVGRKGLLTTLPTDDPMAIWKNYQMIGGLWTKSGENSCDEASIKAGSCNEPVRYTVNGQVNPGHASSLQRGSLELTNMTMETFEQGDQSETPNCFGCHNFNRKDPTAVSHIITQLMPPNFSAIRGSKPSPSQSSTEMAVSHRK